MIVRPIICRPFISRTDELEFLDERRLLAARSQGGLVLLAGDAGIGKSRLLSEFCRQLASKRSRVAYGYCLEHAQRPYGPILDILADFDDVDHSLPPEATKRDQLDALVARFERAAQKSALVAIVEDAHWADAATLALLTFLAPRLEKLRILVVVSFRPNDLTIEEPAYAGLANLMRAARSGRINLAPLDERSLRAFIDETVEGYPLSLQTRRDVGRTSEGNPFFTEELLKNAIEQISNPDPTHAGMPRVLPSSLRAALLERWRKLSDEDRRVLAHAAVIGRTFDVHLLGRTLGSNQAGYLEALGRARNVQLIQEDSPVTFRFRHALTREAIYAEFVTAQLRPMHRSIALALEDAEPQQRSLEGLAYHWWAAGDGVRAVEYNTQAGDAAVAVHALDDAITFYERALQSPALDEFARGDLTDKIADSYFTLGLHQRAREEYRVSAAHFQRSRNDNREARSRSREALAAYMLELSNATDGLEELLERLDPDAFEARSRTHLGIAWIAASLWKPTLAARHLAGVDPRAFENAEIETRFHNIAAWVAMTVGDLATFRVHAPKWIEGACNDGLTAGAFAYANAAYCTSNFGLHTEARALFEQSLERARAARNRNAEYATLAFAAGADLASGDLARAKLALDAIDPSVQNNATVSNALASALIVALHLDDQEMLSTWFDTAGPRFMEAPEPECGAGFAEVLMRRQRPDEARIVLHRAIRPCEQVRGIVPTLLAAAKYAAPEDVVRARNHLVSSAATPTELAEGPALALFDAYVARREHRHADAVALAASAAAGFARVNYPLFEARALECAEHYAAARVIYERCGAVGDVRRIATLLARRGAPAGAAGNGHAETNGHATIGEHEASEDHATSHTQVTWDALLSKREAEVASLVALGKSNAEIAQRLSISPKTVEKHLGSAFVKLGFTSRSQLAAYVVSAT